MRRALLGLSILLLFAGAFVAWDQPAPDGGDYNGNPCDGSIAAAFEDVEADGTDPYTTEFCREPARRQLAVASALFIVAVALLIVRARLRPKDSAIEAEYAP
jgi:hypothetical protein